MQNTNSKLKANRKKQNIINNNNNTLEKKSQKIRRKTIDSTQAMWP